jgi:fibronectin type 3 domain-containing protein
MKSRLHRYVGSGRTPYLLACLILVSSRLCQANVPPPPTPPSPPAGYCSTIYTELSNDLATFSITLNLLAPSNYPTIYAANLETANANAGPQISNPGYMTGILNQLQEMKAMGVQAVMVQVGFPVLYEPFFGSQSAYQPYATFYAQLASTVRSMGLKLIVENDVLLSNDVSAGWTNTTAFYGSLNWTQYQAARAQMAATVATTMQPDYLVLAEEPDSEATQTGQSNLNNPVDAAGMISQEIAAVRALNLSNVKIGAGFGSWVVGLLGAGGYLQEYLTLNVPPNNLDYLDFHIYPINTVSGNSFLTNALTIATTANLAGMPVAMSEAWDWKMEDSEWNVLSPDVIRWRNPFSFWAPIDISFQQMLHNLAQHTQMLYQAPEGPYYLFNYQTFGGTASNGGLANCTCTTASCTTSQIASDETTLAATANLQADYSVTGFSYYNELVTTADKVAPTTPANLSGQAGFSQASVSWTASTDNVGVAGYNIIRNNTWIANTTETVFYDTTVTGGTTYQYQVQAFDLAGNTSPSSTTVSITVLTTTPPTSPTNVVANPVSCQEIDVTWSPAQNTVGLSSYKILRGTSAANLTVVATRNGSTLLYKDYPLSPSTTYYYGIEAVDTSGNVSPISPIVSATTLALPSAPTNVVATPVSGKQITVTWTASAGGLTIASYEIFRGTAPGLLSQIAKTNTTSYKDMGVLPSTTYYYEIQATDSGGNISPISAMASATTLPAPNTPSNVLLKVNSATSLSLTWTDTVPAGGLPIANYKVFCGTSPTALSQVATVKTTSYTYTGRTPATAYYCNVQAVDTAGVVSGVSATVSATTPPMPAAPAGLQITAPASTKIVLTWTETIPPGGLAIGSYKVFCGTSPTGESQVATVKTTSYTYTNRTANTSYYCYVEAVDTGNDVSPASATALATTPPLPNAPANVAATAKSSTSVALTWTETVPTGGLQIASYKIYRGASPTSLSQVATRTTTSYTDNTVSATTTYYYAVQAVDTGGDVSPMSAAAQVTTP